MGLDWKNGCRLSSIALLSVSCLSFQNNLPRIPLPSPGLRWRFLKSISPKSELSSTKSTGRSFRKLFPFEPSSRSNLAINMSNETSSDSSIIPDNISVNGNENNNFVQNENRTNNIKIEEEEEIDNHIEIEKKKRIVYSMDISKHYFDEMEGRSGKDYRWIKPLTKPVSHAMMCVGLLFRFICFMFDAYNYCWSKNFLNSINASSFPHKAFFFSNDRKDIQRRKEVYLSDWTDGFKNLKKVIPAVLFLYFACLSPAIR